jgi:DNA polymerase III delta prime subunit
MLSALSEFYQQFQILAKENPVVAGAVSLWGLSVLTYVARNVPSNILQFLKEQLTTSFSLTNAGNEGNQLRYNAIVTFIFGLGQASFSRSLSLRITNRWHTDAQAAHTEVLPGFGLHFFLWEGRLYWYRRSKLESSGTQIEKESVTISTYGRSHKPFFKLVEQALPVMEKNQTPRLIYNSAQDCWDDHSPIIKRPLNTVITAGGLKETLIGHIETFLGSEKWYIDRGISWKEVYVLHGPPGTGKTSLISAIASHFDLSVAEMDISEMSNKSFKTALSKLGPKTLCLIEDFDSSNAVKTRQGLKPKKTDGDSQDTGSQGQSALIDLDFLTLSGVLNALDGIGNLHGVIVFMTTNCIESIDPALLRKGRSDFIYEVGYLTDKEIRQYAQIAFPGIVIPEDIVFADTPGCNVYAAFKENRNDPVAFLNALEKQMTMRSVVQTVVSFIQKRNERQYAAPLDDFTEVGE